MHEVFPLDSHSLGEVVLVDTHDSVEGLAHDVLVEHLMRYGHEYLCNGVRHAPCLERPDHLQQLQLALGDALLRGSVQLDLQVLAKGPGVSAEDHRVLCGIRQSLLIFNTSHLYLLIEVAIGMNVQ